MRLSKGEAIAIALFMLISWYSLSPLVHSEAMMHTLVEESRGNTPHSLDPTWEIYRLAEAEGIKLTGWKRYWKKRLLKEEEKELNGWLNRHASFELVLEEDLHGTRQQVTKQVWQKKDRNSIHQIQLITYPQHSHHQTHFIYTWSGQIIHEHWLAESEQIEGQLKGIFSSLPQNFTCLEGITNDKLNVNMSITHMFRQWLTQSLEGELREQIEEHNFVSITGFVPAWQERYIMHGDNKLNLQLSARYNALDQQTRVTIGYPLIISEH